MLKIIKGLAAFEFRVPYSRPYLFNAIPDTNHNANPNLVNIAKALTLCWPGIEFNPKRNF